MERYFEGTPPTAEELPALDRAGGGPGHADTHRLRVGQDRRGAGRVDRRAGRLRACARRDGPHGHERRRGARSRSRPTRPGRWSPRSSRPASTRSCRKSTSSASTRGTMKKDETVAVSGLRKGIKLGQLFAGAGQRDAAGRRRRAGRHRGGDQDGRPADRHDAGRIGACRPSPSLRRWSAWPSRPRAAATKPSSPGRCTRSARRTPPSASTATRRPRRWWPPA